MLTKRGMMDGGHGPELKVLVDALSAASQNFDNDLVKHNLVVFRGGEQALQVSCRLGLALQCSLFHVTINTICLDVNAHC